MNDYGGKSFEVTEVSPSGCACVLSLIVLRNSSSLWNFVVGLCSRAMQESNWPPRVLMAIPPPR